jgi:beta-phosphoglucomutase-like phosphatase (HAD superfamily)
MSALNPPESYSAIIFDCDGTLVDSTRLYFHAWQTLFKSHGVEMSWGWFVARLGYSWPQIFHEFQKECGIFLNAAAALQRFNRAYRDEIDTSARSKSSPTLLSVISAKSRWLSRPAALERLSRRHCWPRVCSTFLTP